MDDSMSRFADQSKALWRQHNNTLTSSSTMNNGRNGGGGGATLGDETAAIYAGGSSRQHKRLNKGDGCLGRCPFASVIATIITLCGTGIFTACLYRALTITLQMWTASFKVELDFEWTRVVQTVALVVAAFMCSLAFILLFVGCLATGATRMQVYTGFRSRLGGRISTGFFIVVVYALIGVWSCVTLALVVPLVAYYILVQNCTFKSKQINNHTQQKMDECISLKNFGIELGENKVSVCSNELIAFCNQCNDAGPLFMAAFAASALIVLGLVHYLCCLIANYAHIKDGVKLRDYEEAIKEELELRCEQSQRKRSEL